MSEIDNRSNGCLVLKESNRQAQRTYIIFGLVRGGTSMVAGLLRGFGLNLGIGLLDNHEDPAFVTQDPDRNVIPRLERNEHLRNLIAERNGAESVWGWKYPQAAEYLDDIWGDIRNPHLICVFRDLSAVAMAHERWHAKTASRALSDLNIDMARNLSLLGRMDCPKLTVSYEKALRHPDNFVAQITEFCGINIDPGFDYHGFMKPEVYKNIEEYVVG